MTEISLRDAELTKMINDMTSMVARAEKQQGRDRELLVSEITSKLNEANNSVDLYRMEFRSLSGADRGVYKEKLREHRQALKNLQQEVQWLKSGGGGGNSTAELLQGATKREALDTPDLDTADGLMAHGRKLQDESIKSLQRTAQTVQKTREVAQDTANKVHQQTEQIQRVYDDLFEIDDMLLRSVAIVKRMARRVASQKVLWILIFLIVVGIIVIIVVNTRGSSSTDDAQTRASGAKMGYWGADESGAGGESSLPPIPQVGEAISKYYAYKRRTTHRDPFSQPF